MFRTEETLRNEIFRIWRIHTEPPFRCGFFSYILNLGEKFDLHFKVDEYSNGSYVLRLELTDRKTLLPAHEWKIVLGKPECAWGADKLSEMQFVAMRSDKVSEALSNIIYLIK